MCCMVNKTEITYWFEGMMGRISNYPVIYDIFPETTADVGNYPKGNTERKLRYSSCRKAVRHCSVTKKNFIFRVMTAHAKR